MLDYLSRAKATEPPQRGIAALGPAATGSYSFGDVCEPPRSPPQGGFDAGEADPGTACWWPAKAGFPGRARTSGHVHQVNSSIVRSSLLGRGPGPPLATALSESSPPLLLHFSPHPAQVVPLEPAEAAFFGEWVIGAARAGWPRTLLAKPNRCGLPLRWRGCCPGAAPPRPDRLPSWRARRCRRHGALRTHGDGGG